MHYRNQCAPDALVKGYAQKLVQVFVNLLTNANDASAPGQLIEIASARRAAQVLVTVSDQGKGIAEKHLSRIFEPFFTTKTVGQGTGLGLSLTYNIIQEHGGSITVANRSQGGVRFEILLPGVEAATVAQA
jgi:signal transduction histidine kinase